MLYNIIVGSGSGLAGPLPLLGAASGLPEADALGKGPLVVLPVEVRCCISCVNALVAVVVVICNKTGENEVLHPLLFNV